MSNSWVGKRKPPDPSEGTCSSCESTSSSTISTLTTSSSSSSSSLYPLTSQQASIEHYIETQAKDPSHTMSPQNTQSPPSSNHEPVRVGNTKRIKTRGDIRQSANASQSSGGGKKYRNSPFGLTNHFLGMPDASGAEARLPEVVSSAASSVADSENSNMADWPTNHHHSNHNHNHPNQIRHLVTTKQPTNELESYLADADAGIDAPKCNARDKAEQLSAVDELDSRLGGANSARAAPSEHPGPPQVPDGANAGGGLIAVGFSQGPADQSSSLLVLFSSIMYATFLVILGCIFHISQLRQKSKNSSDHIYTIVVALLGMAWLMFLQVDLQRYKRYASKYILIESIFNDHKQQQQRLQQHQRVLLHGSDKSTSGASSRVSSTGSLVTSRSNIDRLSMNTEVIFKQTAYKMYQQRAAMSAGNRHLATLRNTHSSMAGGSGSQEASGSSQLPMPALDVPLEPAYKFLHGKMGANFYLKCGMAAFCFGHVIHEGLRFGQQLYFFGTGNLHCRDSAALAAHLVTPLYSFYQLFMMFKYSNLVINRHKILAKFGLMHIIGTSVSFWFRTILEEAFEDFVHKMDYFKAQKGPLSVNLKHSGASNDSLASTILAMFPAAAAAAQQQPAGQIQGTQGESFPLMSLMSSHISATISPQIARQLPDSYVCAQNTLLTTKSMNALPYLYPFTIEYNLLLAATFLSLYFNIGRVGARGQGHPSCRQMPVNCASPDGKQAATNDSKERSAWTSRAESLASYEVASSHGHSRHSSSQHSGAGSQHGDNKSLGEYKSNFVVNADCHSANKGLFCGFFVLLVTLVTIVIFFVTINKPHHIQLGIKINLIQEATLTSLILVVTLAAIRQLAKLNRNTLMRDKVTTDDVLMLIPLPFFFIHSLLSFRAESASVISSFHNHGHSSLMSSANLLTAPNAGSVGTGSGAGRARGNSNRTSIARSATSTNSSSTAVATDRQISIQQAIASQPRFDDTKFGVSGGGGSQSSTGSTATFLHGVDHFKLLAIALNVVVMIEVLVQTNFIIDGMRRCSESRYLRFKKPGRELITFAILLNITYWIVATFETKSVEQYKSAIEYYGPLPYMFISHTTLPVMLFYRYHSSVCLTEIWNRAYKPPKAKT